MRVISPRIVTESISQVFVILLVVTHVETRRSLTPLFHAVDNEMAQNASRVANTIRIHHIRVVFHVVIVVVHRRIIDPCRLRELRGNGFGIGLPHSGATFIGKVVRHVIRVRDEPMLDQNARNARIVACIDNGKIHPRFQAAIIQAEGGQLF